MPTILLQSEINEVCISLRDSISEQYSYYAAHMHFLYYYGVRIGEVFDYRITPGDSPGTLSVYPQKKNNKRTLSIVNDSTLDHLEKLNASNELFWQNKRNLQRIIEKEISIAGLCCGNKKIGAHLFRHNYVKKLVREGLQVSTIDQIMGYTTQTVADTYLTSIITYNN
ncbi:tyrosine-type recombinase/integrase [Elizabethkingia meningoseptica]|uniref:tyrosine-type recombinase/integrase n=1 Tax=Elizabethkingia meningoseptica TaxID=238 RepID=UPI002DD64E9D|nr:tyrosine-type recombinase/integrase [Elizabethkingia meningoseptica]MEC4711840.1 tyrosine-type recombinase/integrase [Elizabethkingia meningoseptica]